MGRGLSQLQKSILIIARRNRGRRWKPGGRWRYRDGDVVNREVLIKVYGFRPLYNPQKKRNGCTIFDRRAIGINRYRSASVAVVKAFNRLTKRGLARREYNHGIILTDEGLRVAKTLLA